ncbi:MAG: 5-(carboxyamino)imidazole ribonucleotide synthase [Flavobacteriales bacterium]
MSGRPVIALLGGGQLGRMFIENALRYDVEIHVLDPDPNAPCSTIADRFVQGSLDDARTVVDFAAHADVVGIEIEHVSVEALITLKEQGKRVIPDPEVLRIIQDKGLQKEFYAHHGIPTSPFVLLNGKADLAAHDDLLPGFLKARTGGYDGKGVMPIADAAHVDEAFNGPCVLEKHVRIAKELAVIVVRAHTGGMASYAPVEMVFDDRLNLVDHLRAPARVDNGTLERATELAMRVADAFGAPGIYAVEMFLTDQGEVLVNETAPRAHNSGHHTIEACASSQFDQLLRCYLTWPIGSPDAARPSGMFNLVGTGGEGIPEVIGMDAILGIPGVHLHLYGKQRTRTGRKMGHVSVVAPDEASVDAALALIKAQCRIRPRLA